MAKPECLATPFIFRPLGKVLMMKFGIYYAYWEKEWGGDFIPYIRKVKDLGFDVLEIACGDFHKYPMSYFEELGGAAREQGIELTGGYGPRPEHNISSADPLTVKTAFSFYEDIFPKMQVAGVSSIGGAGYSYWPVDYTKEIDKAGDLKRSIANMRHLADIAQEFDILLYMEVLNRFEGYLLNDTEEGIEYVLSVDRKNVKLMLDTFHMNIEEDSIGDAIVSAGALLGELHVGEPNRRPPQPGRFPWEEVAESLKKIDFDGLVVMEPFVTMGGQVGRDIRIWRDISGGATPEELDDSVAESLKFLRTTFA